MVHLVVRLTIRTDVPGDYSLFIFERGEADNIFDFSWLYGAGEAKLGTMAAD